MKTTDVLPTLDENTSDVVQSGINISQSTLHTRYPMHQTPTNYLILPFFQCYLLLLYYIVRECHLWPVVLRIHIHLEETYETELHRWGNMWRTAVFFSFLLLILSPTTTWKKVWIVGEIWPSRPSNRFQLSNPCSSYWREPAINVVYISTWAISLI